jgi:glycerol kinase
MPPRFLLILSAHSNLLRAALVMQDLRIAASAQQTFEIHNSQFDPAEVWYKTKKVIAACFDIGRTLTREIAGVVIVSQETAMVIWHEQGNEVMARGMILQSADSPTHDEWSAMKQDFSGTMGAWLLWNLTGVFATGEMSFYGKTRARSPFDAELPVVAVLNETGIPELGKDSKDSEADRVILGAAQVGWASLVTEKQNEFAND